MKKKCIVPALIVVMIILFGGNKIASHFFSNLPELLRLILFTIVVPYGILLSVCYLILRGMDKVEFGKPQPLSNGSLFKMAMVQTGLSFPVLMILNIFMMIVFEPVTLDMAAIDKHIFFYLFLFLIFNPVVEEIFFRKLILQRLRPLGDKKALWISAVFFAIPHLFSQGLPQLGYTFILGLVWGSIALRCNSLKECIILHAFSNAYGVFLPLLLLKSPQGTVVIVVLNFLMIFAGISLALKNNHKLLSF